MSAPKSGSNKAMSQVEKIDYLKQSLLWKQIMRTKDTLENTLTDEKLGEIRDAMRTSIGQNIKLETMGSQLTHEVAMALYGMEKLIANGLATGEDPNLIKGWAETIEMRNDPQYVLRIAATLRDIFRSVKIVEASS